MADELTLSLTRLHMPTLISALLSLTNATSRAGIAQHPAPLERRRR